VEALRRGKSVWVEKPLALDLKSLEEVTEAWIAAASPRLMVGFNRRFAPLVLSLRDQLPGGPKEFRYTVNAGSIPEEHWSVDPAEGGGRVVGEACHFVDLLRSLADAAITRVEARRGAGGAQVWIEFAGGSTGVVDYLTTGAKGYPKERLEVFAAGRVWVLDNFRRLRRFPQPAWPTWPRPQDKGQAAAIQAFLASVRRGTPAPIRFDEIEEVSRWTIQAAAQLLL
jgi:predicted dehydrogenase